MKIFNIVLKEIKHNLRDKQTMIIMIAFPIVLMWILGTAFSGGMDGTSLMFDNTKVAYSIVGEGQRVQAFEAFIKEMEKYGIKPTRIQEYNKGINSVKETEYACYIDFNDKENKINLFIHDSIVKYLLDLISDSETIIILLYKVILKTGSSVF